jgi:hypothetical protein
MAGQLDALLAAGRQAHQGIMVDACTITRADPADLEPDHERADCGREHDAVHRVRAGSNPSECPATRRPVSA